MSALTHWNDSAGTRALLTAIDRQTDPEHAQFVPITERSAAIDNDGTLWCEKPMYVQIDFVLRRWKEMLRADPGLATAQPYKALAEQDLAWFGHVQEQMPVILEAIGNAFSGISPEQYAEQVVAFFEQARHPVRNVPYQQVVYSPMRELLDYLRQELSGVCDDRGRARFRAGDQRRLLWRAAGKCDRHRRRSGICERSAGSDCADVTASQ